MTSHPRRGADRPAKPAGAPAIPLARWSGARGFVALAILVVAAWSASGCFVIALDHFYDDASIVFDERLLGAWTDAEDNIKMTIERSDWRSYRIKYVHPIETGLLTAYLFKDGTMRYLDLAPVHGQEFGSFLLPGHAVVRVQLDAATLSVQPLAYDWFTKALGARTLPASLLAASTERNQVVLAGSRTALRQWLSARVANDPAFGPPSTFKKDPAPSVPEPK